jgi:hypothetical protein
MVVIEFRKPVGKADRLLGSTATAATTIFAVGMEGGMLRQGRIRCHAIVYHYDGQR